MHTTAEMKGATYGALRMLLEQGRLALPASAADLLRELLLLRVTLTQQGGERIEAGIGHDDLADALMLAMGPYQDNSGAWRSHLGDVVERVPLMTGGVFDCETVTTGGGVVLPRVPVLTDFGMNGNAVSTESYMPSDRPVVIRKGELILVGAHHIDKPPRVLSANDIGRKPTGHRTEQEAIAAIGRRERSRR